MARLPPNGYFTRWPDGDADRGPVGPERRAAEVVRDLAVELANERRLRGWGKQIELANAAGITRTTLARIESGSTWPDVVVLAKVTEALDLEIKLERRTPNVPQ